MALKDVKKYYIDVQSQYLEMLNDTREYDLLYQEGRVSEEQFEAFKNQLMALKINYERLSYIMFLLNQPKDKKRKEDYYKSNVYDYLKDASDTRVIQEDEDVLKQLKEMIQEAKKNDRRSN